MDQKLTFDGIDFVSSKEAALLTGYAQDYIGQLARGGKVRARRVGGLWYVNLESLGSYKATAEAFVPKPPRYDSLQGSSDDFIGMDGKRMISSKRGSEISGYNQDYVTQLARTSQIHAQQAGSRWFVDQAELLAHKSHNDGLLRAVQAQSVGLAKSEPTAQNSHRDSENAPLYIAEKPLEMPFFEKATWVERDFANKSSNVAFDTGTEEKKSSKSFKSERKSRLPVRRAGFFPMVLATTMVLLLVSTLAMASFGTFRPIGQQYAASNNAVFKNALPILDIFLAERIHFVR